MAHDVDYRVVMKRGLTNVEEQTLHRAVGFEDHALAMKKSVGDTKTGSPREIRAPRRSVLWQRVDATGNESFLLSRDDTGWHLEGNVVALLDREPAHVRYRVVCDPS